MPHAGSAEQLHAVQFSNRVILRTDRLRANCTFHPSKGDHSYDFFVGENSMSELSLKRSDLRDLGVGITFSRPKPIVILRSQICVRVLPGRACREINLEHWPAQHNHCSFLACRDVKIERLIKKRHRQRAGLTKAMKSLCSRLMTSYGLYGTRLWLGQDWVIYTAAETNHNTTSMISSFCRVVAQTCQSSSTPLFDNPNDRIKTPGD